MLAEKEGAGDPASFRESELFEKCRELGLIPRSEAELELKETRSAPAEGEAREVTDERSVHLSLKLRGMWCPACAWVIEESLKKKPGISDVHCSFSSDRLVCDYDPVLLSPSQIISSIASLGYDAHSPADASETGHKRREIIRFAVSAFLTMNVMMISLALYAGFFTQFSGRTIRSLSWPIFVMASIVLFYGGRRIYRRAWAGIRHGGSGMEALITVGAFSAYIYSTWQLLSGNMHLYYDTASMLIVLVTLGKFLESRAKAKVQEDLELLFSLRPSKVKILVPGERMGRYAAAEQLGVGDLFQVDAGEIVPADGKVLEGKATVDESSITGEAVPILKEPGDDLRGGVRVIQGLLKVRAERVGADSTLGQMLQIVEKALKDDTPFQGETDRILRWFVPAVTALAVGTVAVCLMTGLSMEAAFLRGLTVLVISCPCTLGIAIPLARIAGISLAGRMGIIVREFSSFEQAQRMDAVVFDKTGTITHGKWTLLNVTITDHITRERAIALAASLEKESDHTIALELGNRAREANLELPHASDATVFENGISARVDGNEVRIGSRDFLKNEIDSFVSAGGEVSLHGRSHPSRVFMSVGGKLSAVFEFGDEIRKGSRTLIRDLRARGHELYLLSGDGEETTRFVGDTLGIEESHGGMRPGEKGAFIKGLQDKHRHVTMVGDGINDAPALARADLGIAVCAGGNPAGETSHVTLMAGDPGRLMDFLNLAARVNRKIRQNLIFSGLYNCIAIPVAMRGLLNPLIAVSAMLLSSLTVIANTLLLVRTTHKQEHRPAYPAIPPQP